ncbi:MAG: metal-dependent hydrolase [Blastocatellia bacterium]|nr:metal-dependent hydrolase [Blastocatellia bacterium]
MENLAHTLLGLTLAKSGLERATPLATATLIISSNLPDIDAVTRLASSAISYLEYHRGFTHSLVGLAVLSAVLTLLIVYYDRRFRLRRDPFLRPVRGVRIFALAYLGGLGHVFMDFTNSYGVRPFLPFSNRWFYGDIAFVVDPWIWLILGSAVVWLTAKTPARIIFWLIAGTAMSLLMALAFREPQDGQTIIPPAVRVIWFAALAIVILGAALRWGRAGEKLARYSLLILAIYYSGMWVAHRSALDRARKSSPVETAHSAAAWPMPANVLLWQSVIAGDDLVYTRYINLSDSTGEWRKENALEERFVGALRRSEEARTFLDFMRYGTAIVEEREDGYTVTLRDLRFPLRMNAVLDRDLAVRSVSARWY